MKKKLLFMSIAALTLLVLGACGGSNSTSDKNKTEIKYYSFSATPDYEDQLNEMVENLKPQTKKSKLMLN